MGFLGMVGYQRKFNQNVSTIAELLARLLSKRERVFWSPECKKQFKKTMPYLKPHQF